MPTTNEHTRCAKSLPLVMTVLALVLCGYAACADDASTYVGLEGLALVRIPGAAVVAKPVGMKAPLVVRVRRLSTEGDLALYEIRYVGAVTGKHNLVDCLERADGSPVTGVPPVIVTVKGLLAEKHSGVLIEPDHGEPVNPGGYRTLLWVVGALWLVPLVLKVVRRLCRTTAVPETVDELPPTVIERLRSLLDAAEAGTLDVSSRAEVSMLLLASWREHLSVEDLSPTELIDRMRRHPQAGGLLERLDAWLYERTGSADADGALVLKEHLQDVSSAEESTDGRETA